MTDAWEMHQVETGLNPGPVWRDRGVIINTLTERNQALEERVAELEGSCQKLRDDYQGALAEVERWKATAGFRVAQILGARQRAEAADSDAREAWSLVGQYRSSEQNWIVRATEAEAALASPAEDTTPEPTPADGGCDCIAGTVLAGPGVLHELGCARVTTPDAEPQAEDTTPTEQQAQDGTDWQAYARDYLSGDPERLRQHLPEWMHPAPVADPSGDTEGGA